jgi:hypothetical protein
MQELSNEKCVEPLLRPGKHLTKPPEVARLLPTLAQNKAAFPFSGLFTRPLNGSDLIKRRCRRDGNSGETMPLHSCGYEGTTNKYGQDLALFWPFSQCFGPFLALSGLILALFDRLRTIQSYLSRDAYVSWSRNSIFYHPPCICSEGPASGWGKSFRNTNLR